MVGYRDRILTESRFQLPSLCHRFVEPNGHSLIHQGADCCPSGYNETFPPDETDQPAPVSDRQSVLLMESQRVVGQTKRRDIDGLTHEPEDPVGSAAHDDGSGLGGASQSGSGAEHRPLQPRASRGADNEKGSLVQCVHQPGDSIYLYDPPTQRGKTRSDLIENLGNGLRITLGA